MDGQLHIVLLTDGDHRLQEVLKVAEQILVGHGGVLGEELFQLRHALRLPARHLEVTGTLLDAVGKGLGIGPEGVGPLGERIFRQRGEAKELAKDKVYVRSLLEKAKTCKGLDHREAAVLLEAIEQRADERKA